ncbi:hypothetical protein GQS40_07935|uniref:dTDP-4-dehydro-6-deoxy-alpha-D-glucopyranose 2,3-dehydratase domain-containing protein n=1 Tax=Leuconostoc lactis TaxID=1246 RepID=A0A6L7A7V4_LEULA|nr:hypothetical protein [Leuconostoc lactis]
MVEKLYVQQLSLNQGIQRQVMLSEEGGRFYHEQNLNVIMAVDDDAIPNLPDDYLWVFSVRQYQISIDGREITSWDQPLFVAEGIAELALLTRIHNGVREFLIKLQPEIGTLDHVEYGPTIQWWLQYFNDQALGRSIFESNPGDYLPQLFQKLNDFKMFEATQTQLTSLLDIAGWELTDKGVFSQQQAERFYRKRNRNIIIKVDDDVEVLDNFRWMTLGQIKKMMSEDNLINMDTRTVLSGLPFVTNTLTSDVREGVLNFLMQAKIEPGNINAVQISPTIQATKSNFMAKHGGKKPAYLDYFLNAKQHQVIYDQIQSEQSSSVEETALSQSTNWFLDQDNGTIHNQNNSFFSVVGVKQLVNDEVVAEQPMILQPEIGYLGIIVAEIENPLWQDAGITAKYGDMY